MPLTFDEEMRIQRLRQTGAIVVRNGMEVEFFYERKDAGAWLQHVYGINYHEAKEQGIVLQSFHGRTPKPGDVVTYRGGGKNDYLLNNPKKEVRYGILDHTYGADTLSICFDASCFRQGGYISNSGGPIPCILPTGLTLIGLRETRFWRWGLGSAGASMGGNYYINVPNWLWDGEEAPLTTNR